MKFYKKYIFYFLLIILSMQNYAQPQIDVHPNKIKFEDVFNRIKAVYIINDGMGTLYIDSVSFNKSIYSLHFENNFQTPLYIQPYDSIKMIISLTGYYYVTNLDTTDTLFIYNNTNENPAPLGVSVNFFEDDFGTVTGTVSDGATLLDSTNLYFFYNGIYLCGTTVTNYNGNYQIELPEGNYTVAAERPGYRMEFFDSTYDPYFARFAEVNDSDTIVINFDLQKIQNQSNSVSGFVYDSISGNIINKGVVVVRKGTHTPTLLKQNVLYSDSSVYAGFIKPDGSYQIFVEDSSYYFIQSFSDYFLPTYYNTNNIASVFWQNADSLNINQNVNTVNLYLKPDSSYGGGGAYGNILLPPSDALGFDGITILAKSTTSSQLYSYNFGKEDGFFYLYNLPYGTYQLIAQRIGSENAFSQTFTISPNNPLHYGLDILFTTTDIKPEENLLPDMIKLNNNYPNPFNPSTIISFSIPQSTFITLKVYDVLGNEIATLVNEEKTAGFYQVSFNASSLSSGVYFYTIRADNFTSTKKMLLMK